MMAAGLCHDLGMTHPVIQAPIGGAATDRLAIAVTRAGGLGAIAMTGRPRDWVERAAAAARAEVDGRVICNFLLPFDIDAELGLCLDLGMPLISLFWGDFTPHLPRIHAAGARAIVTVGSVEEARRAAEGGVDIIVAQGWEAGGHVRGNLSTLVLVPEVVDAVAPVPVVAAGGIGDGRALAAALALGAEAGWVGTRFLAAEEADLHPHYRARVRAATGEDTIHSGLYDIEWPDAPGRTLRNSTSEAWIGAGRPPPGRRPGEGEVILRRGDGSTRLRYEPVTVVADDEGDVEAAPLWAGQCVSRVGAPEPAAHIVAALSEGARDALTRLNP